MTHVAVSTVLSMSASHPFFAASSRMNEMSPWNLKRPTSTWVRLGGPLERISMSAADRGANACGGALSWT